MEILNSKIYKLMPVNVPIHLQFGLKLFYSNNLDVQEVLWELEMS